MDDEKFDLNSRIWVWFNSVLSYDNIIAHDFLNEIDGCATFADVIIGLADRCPLSDFLGDTLIGSSSLLSKIADLCDVDLDTALGLWEYASGEDIDQFDKEGILHISAGSPSRPRSYCPSRACISRATSSIPRSTGRRITSRASATGAARVRTIGGSMSPPTTTGRSRVPRTSPRASSTSCAPRRARPSRRSSTTPLPSSSAASARISSTRSRTRSSVSPFWQRCLSMRSWTPASR